MKICAEIGQVPGSDLSLAIKLIQEAFLCGAHAVKVQAIQPNKIATATADPYWEGADVDQRTAFERAGVLHPEDIRSLAVVAHSYNLLFGASPFDTEESLDACEGSDFIKIASGDIRYRQLIAAAAQRTKHLIVSTGASTWPEIRDVIEWTRPFHTRLTFLACTLDYPTAMVDANLGRVRTLQSMIGLTRNARGVSDTRLIDVGYSDHTSNRHVGFACGVLGCSWLEVHYAGSLKNSSRSQTVRDCDFALDEVGLQYYVADSAIGIAVKGEGQLTPTPNELDAYKGARRGLYAARKIEKGRIMLASDIAILRPWNGLEPTDVETMVGKPAWRSFEEGDSLA